MVLTTLSKKYC